MVLSLFVDQIQLLLLVWFVSTGLEEASQVVVDESLQFASGFGSTHQKAAVLMLVEWKMVVGRDVEAGEGCSFFTYL